MSDTNELRLKIAKLRGWRMDEAWDSPADTGLCAPKGDYVLSVPDWPNDPGAALALCLEIGKIDLFDRLILKLWNRPKGTYLALFERLAEEKPRPVLYRGEGETPAEALARLAYAALDEAVRDE
ncbi:MAG: hypothetical protein ACYTBJ_14970 [Planctomycetota bacterium]|jgi:hypothetical protein